MVLLQISVVLTTIALIALGLLLYGQYVSNSVSEIIEGISNQTGLVIGGGGPTQTLPGNITLPENMHIVQNEIHDTRYTAILITENITS